MQVSNVEGFSDSSLKTKAGGKAKATNLGRAFYYLYSTWDRRHSEVMMSVPTAMFGTSKKGSLTPGPRLSYDSVPKFVGLCEELCGWAF